MWCWGLNSLATCRQAVYQQTCVLGLGNRVDAVKEATATVLKLG